MGEKYYKATGLVNTGLPRVIQFNTNDSLINNLFLKFWKFNERKRTNIKSVSVYDFIMLKLRPQHTYLTKSKFSKTLNNLFYMPCAGIMLWLVLHKAPKITMKVSHIILCAIHFYKKKFLYFYKLQQNCKLYKQHLFWSSFL